MVRNMAGVVVAALQGVVTPLTEEAEGPNGGSGVAGVTVTAAAGRGRCTGVGAGAAVAGVGVGGAGAEAGTSRAPTEAIGAWTDLLWSRGLVAQLCLSVQQVCML